jgi:hypothetical protein
MNDSSGQIAGFVGVVAEDDDAIEAKKQDIDFFGAITNLIPQGHTFRLSRQAAHLIINIEVWDQVFNQIEGRGCTFPSKAVDCRILYFAPELNFSRICPNNRCGHLYTLISS